jgi:hypothetical protein
MNKRLFTNKIFRIVLILFVAIDLLIVIDRISGNNEFATTLILRSLNIILTLTTFISLFKINKYSLTIIKIYIILKLLILPIFMVVYGLKVYLFNFTDRYSIGSFIESYSENWISILFGFLFYYFFKKYSIKNLEEQNT